MTEDETRGSTQRSTRLPATLLFIMVTAIAGAVLWLTLTPPPQDPEADTSPVKLGRADATAPAPEASRQPPREQPPADRDSSTAPSAGTPSEDRPPESTPEPPPAPSPQTGPDLASAPPPEQSEPPVPNLPDSAQQTPAPPEGENAAPPPEQPTAPATAAAPASEPAEQAQPGAAVAPPVAPMIAKLPPAPPSPPLPRAPDPALIEETAKGLLPVVGRDGREAWRVYARPFNRDDRRPKIAVVLYGLGSSSAATRTAIQGLPGAITLAFTPYANDLPDWIADARAAGHEVLLMVPMEPANYPDFDPGPQALLTSLDNKANTERLEWMLGRGVGYVGVTDFMGSRFTTSAPHMRAFLENLRKRGLMFLESRAAARTVAGEIASVVRVPFTANTLYIDTLASRAAIDGQLREAERLARKLEEVVVMGFLYPVTLERVALWARSVEQRDFVLAPVSALAKRKEP